MLSKLIDQIVVDSREAGAFLLSHLIFNRLLGNFLITTDLTDATDDKEDGKNNLFDCLFHCDTY